MLRVVALCGEVLGVLRGLLRKKSPKRGLGQSPKVFLLPCPSVQFLQETRVGEIFAGGPGAETEDQSVGHRLNHDQKPQLLENE